MAELDELFGGRKKIAARQFAGTGVYGGFMDGRLPYVAWRVRGWTWWIGNNVSTGSAGWLWGVARG